MMKKISQKQMRGIFGSVDTSFEPCALQEKKIACTRLKAIEPFCAMQLSSLQTIIFSHQVHGTDGLYIKNAQQVPMPFSIESDFLYTDQKGIGLAITTADCVPIILYCEQPSMIAVIHAGWRGTVKGIIKEALEQITTYFCCSPDQLYVYIGPYARSCCYAVSNEVIDAVGSQGEAYQKTLIFRSPAWFFDTGLFNKIALEQSGVPSRHINTDASQCTICTVSYCSFRRDKTRYRQVSLVYLA